VGVGREVEGRRKGRDKGLAQVWALLLQVRGGQGGEWLLKQCPTGALGGGV